jgi:hypothetical protein
MGTRRQYLCFTRWELERAIADPVWGREFADEMRSTPSRSRSPIAVRRVLDLDKSWVELDLLLRLHGIPLAAHIGQHLLDPADPPALDGFGVPYGWNSHTYLTPEEVTAAAHLLGPLDLHEMYRAIEPEVGDREMAPFFASWDEVGLAVEVLRHSFTGFFEAAATAGQAIVVQTV